MRSTSNPSQKPIKRLRRLACSWGTWKGPWSARWKVNSDKHSEVLKEQTSNSSGGRALKYVAKSSTVPWCCSTHSLAQRFLEECWYCTEGMYLSGIDSYVPWSGRVLVDSHLVGPPRGLLSIFLRQLLNTLRRKHAEIMLISIRGALSWMYSIG